MTVLKHPFQKWMKNSEYSQIVIACLLVHNDLAQSSSTFFVVYTLKNHVANLCTLSMLNFELRHKRILKLKGLVHNYVSFFEVLRYWALKFSIFLWY